MPARCAAPTLFTSVTSHDGSMLLLGVCRNGHSKPAAVNAREGRNGSRPSTGSPFIDALDAELGRLRRFVGARSEELWGRLLAVIEVPLSRRCLEF